MTVAFEKDVIDCLVCLASCEACVALCFEYLPDVETCEMCCNRTPNVLYCLGGFMESFGFVFKHCSSSCSFFFLFFYCFSDWFAVCWVISLLYCCLFAPAFASTSAFSFPSMLTFPGIHRMTTLTSKLSRKSSFVSVRDLYVLLSDLLFFGVWSPDIVSQKITIPLIFSG